MSEAVAITKEERYQAAQKATLIGVVVNVILSIAKIVAGIVGHSAAMLADGIHSASDLVSDGVVLLGMRMAREEADEDHPYGHGKFETLATLFIAVALLGVSLGIVLDAVDRMQEPTLEVPTMIALVAAIFSLLCKEGLFQYTIKVGERLNAKALIANAWHHRSDAISSLAALAGIAGAMLGWPLADSAAAIAVSFILAKVGFEFLQEAVKELTDSSSAIDEEVRKKISELVDSIPDVRSAHFLKARRLGPDILVDVHVVVNPLLSVSEGHHIADKVQNTLTDEVDGINEVLVHVDVEDDQKGGSLRVLDLPNRKEVQESIYRVVHGGGDFMGVSGYTAHYLPEGLQLELRLAPMPGQPLEALQTAAEEISKKLKADIHNCIEVAIFIGLTEQKQMA
ncbi:MAG: cation transporter [Magnetococcales bacterium]|nr:cation transporter [Magnetococcales bacterium]